MSAGDRQRTDEWTLDASGRAYHLKQWDEPKQSTKVFARVLDGLARPNGLVVDLGCGAGAATSFLATAHPNTPFLGIDYSADVVALARELSRARPASNLRFEQGDWYALDRRDDVDGVVSLQTLSWLPDFERPLAAAIERLTPRWLAMTSLFYPGEVSCRIEVTEHAKADKRCFYNVYAIPVVDRFCRARGYALTRAERFDLELDLAPPADLGMGTYTIKTDPASPARGARLQVSGPLLMSWYTLVVERR
jgi:SAM-dependent methyltransferase